ncbi:MAG: DNA polymerase I [Oscillospiraceae bacterium]
MKLLVLDGNSIINRAFYGIKLLTTKDGQFTNAIYGFMNILLKLEADETPDETAIAFDLRAPTFRHKMYDGYKAQRKGMPEELAAQMPVLKELLTLLGYKLVTLEGYEADDILGTLSAKAAERGDECVIATGDRDSLQLVGEHVRVLLASTQMGRSVTVNMDESAVAEKYGIKPKQLIEVKSLMGDASDNIPGVAGVGEKTALALVSRFGTLDEVYANIDSEDIKKGVRQKLIDNKDMAYLSRKLAEIDCHVPVCFEKGEYIKQEPKAQEAAALLAKLEMASISQRLHLNNIVTEQTALSTAALPSVEASDLPKLSGKVYVALSGNVGICVQEETIYTASEESLVKLLADNDAEKLVFDAKPLYRLALKHGADAANITFDAKLAAYLINPSASDYTVVQLAAEYGIEPTYNSEYPEASVLKRLFDALRERCDREGMTPLLNDIELPLCKVLADMEHSGIAVDSSGLQDFGSVLREEIDKQLASIYEQVGYEFNVNSPKQLGKALFEDMGLPSGKKTKSGFSTNAETLENLRVYSPVIDNILLYRTYQKLNSTYAEGLLKVVGDDGRIHSTFNQTETRTGRISSGEPNLQNIPVRTKLGRELRKFFIAEKGKILLDADYSQIELRILAHIANDSAMIEIFRTGGDIHQSTAAKIYHLDEKDVTSAQRSSAKAVNFGIVYGISAFSLSKDINVSVKEASGFIKNYLDTFEGVKKYMDETVEKGKENGYVSTMFGRRRSLPELASSNFNIRALGERMAMNTPIQGTAADIIKLAMIRVFNRLKDEGLKAKLVLQVHDELIVECPVDEQERAEKILGEEMQNAAKLCVPLKADVNSGDTWYSAKG